MDPQPGDRGRRLAIIVIKSFHSAVFLFFSACILFVLYSGLTGRRDGWLLVAIGLVLLEALVFALGRARCPLTSLALRLGDRTGHDYLSEWLLPPALIRYTVPTCTGLFVLGLLAVALSWLLGA